MTDKCVKHGEFGMDPAGCAVCRMNDAASLESMRALCLTGLQTITDYRLSNESLIAERDGAIAEASAAKRDLQDLATIAAGRVYFGHNDTCGAVLSTTPYPCSCGHDELDAAVAKYLEVRP